jgi:signal peptidase I
MESTQSLIRDYGGTILAAIAVALLIRFFLIEAYRIPSSAMRPALEPGDTIFVAKWPFRIASHTPKHGDVVVFSLPGPDDSQRDYIKRVVGVPGDTVALKGGHVFINNVPTELSGSQKANCASEKTPEGFSYPVCFENPTIEDFGPEKVPEGSVFVLGDFRAKTPREPGTDRPMKSWGIQPISTLKGTALWIWLSIEPQNSGVTSGFFPSLRLDRMFRRIQ